MILKKEKLVGLLNEMYLKGSKNIQIRYANMNLCRVELGKKVTFQYFIDEKSYESPLDEMPTFQDFLLCFQASNVLKWNNQDEILKQLEKEVSRNTYHAEKKLYLSFDTCSLSHRDNNVIYSFLWSVKKFPGIVMSTGVKKELKDWDKKYKNTDELKTKVYSANRFVGQLMLDARRVKIGTSEYRRLSKSPYTIEVESDNGDENIIESLKKHQQEKNVEVMVLTEDTNFVEMARDEGVHSKLIIQQRKLPLRLECSWEKLCDWIYVAAIIFGAIKVGNAWIYGIWTGKEPKNWYNNELNVEFAKGD